VRARVALAGRDATAKMEMLKSAATADRSLP